MRLWAAGLISDTELRARATFTVDVALLAVADDTRRDIILRPHRS